MLLVKRMLFHCTEVNHSLGKLIIASNVEIDWIELNELWLLLMIQQ